METQEPINDEPEKETKIGISGIHVKDGNKTVDIGLKGIHVVDNGKEVIVNGKAISKYVKKNPTSIIIFNVFIVLTIASYLLLGFLTERGWSVGWVLFLLIPVGESIIDCINTRQVARFNFAILVTNIFCFVGMMWSIWHPTWVIFLLIPVFYTIAALIDKKRGVYKIVNEPSEFVKKVDSEALDVDVEIHKDEEN